MHCGRDSPAGPLPQGHHPSSPPDQGVSALCVKGGRRTSQAGQHTRWDEPESLLWRLSRRGPPDVQTRGEASRARGPEGPEAWGTGWGPRLRWSRGGGARAQGRSCGASLRLETLTHMGASLFLPGQRPGQTSKSAPLSDSPGAASEPRTGSARPWPAAPPRGSDAGRGALHGQRPP